VRAKGAKCNSQGQAKRSPWDGPRKMHQALKARQDVVAPQFLFDVSRTVAAAFRASSAQTTSRSMHQGFHACLFGPPQFDIMHPDC